MASSGKKGKKAKDKGTPVPWTLVLQDSSGITSVPKKSYNWSEEVEDSFNHDRPMTSYVLPTAPRSTRETVVSEDKVPDNPPYMAFLSNLSYDIIEDDIAEFFDGMSIQNIRLPKDDRDSGKVKGYGYVEFNDKNSLIAALSVIETNLKGRRIKIELSTERKGGRMDSGRDRMDRPEVSTGDWRAGPRSDPPPDSRGGREGGGGGGGFNRDRERGEFTREKDSNFGSFTREREGDSGRSGAWRDGDRPSYDNNRSSDRPMYRDGGGSGGGGFSDRPRYGDREWDRDRGDDRRGGSFGPRRNYGDNFDRENTRRDDGPPSESSGEPRMRPKLNLKPRTKPVEEQAQPSKEVNDAPAPAAANIFGAAKPVDTSIRERQIEERLAKEKDTGRPRDSSKEKYRDEEEPKRDTWARRRNDDRDDDRRKDDTRRDDDRRQGDDDTRRDNERRRNDERPSNRDLPPRKPEHGAPTTMAAGNNDDIQDDDVDEKKHKDRAPVRKDDRPARKDERPPRDNYEREMPKLKEPKPPNFVGSNIYATLDPEADLSE